VLCALASSPALVLLAACAATPAGPKFTSEAAKNIEGAARAICEFEEMIPDVGAELELTCGVQVAAFDRWVDSEAAPGVPKTVRVKLRRRGRDAGAEGGR
jgi:hypothetical protein